MWPGPLPAHLDEHGAGDVEQAEDIRLVDAPARPIALASSTAPTRP